MRKILFGTTAIVGITFATQALAAGPELSLSGFSKFEMDFVDQDLTALSKGYRFEVDDFEIDFKAEATADNGLTYGTKLEMQFANGDAGADFTDEATIYFSGNWGTLILGNDDGANADYHIAGYGIIGGMGAWDGEKFFTNDSGAFVDSALSVDSGDATKVSYFTPSFSGFSVGASWIPDSGHFGGEALSSGDDDDIENSLAVAAKYEGSFNEVGIAVSGIYVNGSYENNDDDGAPSEQNDASAWSVGAQISYAGFALAASYNDNGDSGVTKTDEAAGADAGTWWDVALSYETGPYSVGVGYFSSETDINNGGTIRQAEADYFALTGGWNVAPGLDFYAEYDYVELEDGLAATTNDNEANVFMVGTKVSF